MPPSFDPAGFQIAVEVIIADTGLRVPLWTDSGARAVSGRDYGIPLDLPFVESVEITMSRGLVAQVSVSLAAPFSTGIRLLEGDLFRIGNKIEVRLGYPRAGRFLPWIRARVGKPPTINISADEGLTATITGDGGGFAALRGASSRTYTGSYRQILTEIASHKHNDWKLALPIAKANSPLDEQRVRVSQENRSEWFFVQQLARTANCDAYLRPSRTEEGRITLDVTYRQEAFERDPRFTFVMRGRVDFETFFPLLSFTSDAAGAWLPRSNAGTQASDVSVTDGSVVTEEAGPTTSPVPATGQALAGTGNSRAGGGPSALHPEQDSDESVGERMVISSRDPRTQSQLVRSRYEEGRIRGAINGTMTSFGIPELFPGDLVRLLGLGIFEGRYMVDSMTHRAAPGEWSMDLNLLSNAVQTGAIAEHLQLSPEIINTREPPGLSDGSESALGGGSPVEAAVEGVIGDLTRGSGFGIP